MTTNDGGRVGFSLDLGNVCQTSTYQIPSVVLHGHEFILSYDSPDKVVGQCSRSKLKVQLNIVDGAVVQVHEGAASLECPLEEIMTWPKGKDSVQRSDIASSSGEVEEVGMAVRDQATFSLWFRELAFVYGEVDSEPSGGIC
ncbi:hypothetical protein CVT25_011214 [Psilocybe cyanescens]|uniref:Uncharacterized protein n=1 Tax=Psilocybe cyanescens TaxID=93625 RepID=A0A409WGZ9_PSICY|nr:hypothetical protein CVT25_011214 [Psilocybe cyanescens]